ncbi:MAG: DNA polymerase III subunit delta' [Methylocapsa sp.]|nr:DNA polymerase III subunit delta' [Methylocapsa sp.]
MPKPLAETADLAPESDRFEQTPHPRETYKLFGHVRAEQELRFCLLQGRFPNAFIFGGPPGIGKATLAWRLARFLLANPELALVRDSRRDDLFVPPDAPVSRLVAMLAHPDLVLLRREWDPEKKRHTTQIPVDAVRRAISLFQRAAGCGGYRICIVDSADDLNSASANALLKLVEEPPPRSLFLFAAHRPGRMIPTLRSRCRKIQLHPLGAADIEKVLSSLGSHYSSSDGKRREAAIARAQGSIHRALRLLGDEQISLDRSLMQLLDGLPRIDWGTAHALAERIAAHNNGKDYEAALAATEEWLDAKIHLGARESRGDCSGRLVRYAEVWEKLTEAAREADIFNLDKRPLVLSLIADLASAVRAARF